MKSIRKWSKKKKCIAVLVVVIVASVSVTIGVHVHKKSEMAAGMEMTVQSATAEKGSVSTTVIGNGTLEGSSGTDISIPSGIVVKKVLVENGDEVKVGDKLATVDEASVAAALLEVKENIDAAEDAVDELSSEADDSTTTEYLKKKVLEGQLESLEETKTLLTTMLKKKAIVATKDGIVTSINVSAGSKNVSEETTGGENLQVSANVSTTTNCSTTASAYGLTFLSTAQEETELDSPEEKEEEVIRITKCELNVTAPVTGNQPQSEIKETEEFTGTISWNCKNQTFQAGKAYTAKIQLTAKEGYAFSDDIKVEIAGASVNYELQQKDNGESVLDIEATFTKTAEKTKSYTENKKEEKNEKISSAGATSKQSNRTSKTASVSTGNTVVSEVASVSEEYEIEETTAFTIASDKEVTVSISVDELDILTIKEGQKATITLDALEGESYEGTIAKVSRTASSGGSSVKYPVEITLEKTEDMLLGMSASATIIVEESEEAVVIPVSALQEKGNKTFVYTEQDADGNLSGEVEVEVGLSNGTQVEITSGLEEGTTVYYLKSESTSDTTDGEFPGGAMPEMGEMPDGGKAPEMGEMPSGEMPGGEMPGGDGNQGGGQR